MAKDYDFKHATTDPYYPKSNGLAEKAIGIVKNMLRKGGAADLDISLMNYRACSLANGKTPSELKFGRTICTRLPTRVIVSNSINESFTTLHSSSAYGIITTEAQDHYQSLMLVKMYVLEDSERGNQQWC